MQRVSAGFDRIAPFYSVLSGIVFGRSHRQAQACFLNELKPNDRILILGGGSGELLQAVLKKQPDVLVDYIDISPGMIRLARAKTANPSALNFIVGTEYDIPDRSYEIVITNFYLDLFNRDSLLRVIHQIRTHVKPHGRWLITEFVQEKSWHTFMLWIMYRFFRIATGIEAGKLPDWRSSLKKAGMQLMHSKEFYGGFIQSAVYRRSD